MTEVAPYVERKRQVYSQDVQLEMDEPPPILPPRDRGRSSPPQAAPARPSVHLARQPAKNYEDLPVRKSYGDLPPRKSYEDLPGRQTARQPGRPEALATSPYGDLPPRPVHRSTEDLSPTKQRPPTQPPRQLSGEDRTPAVKPYYDEVPGDNTVHGDYPRLAHQQGPPKNRSADHSSRSSSSGRQSDAYASESEQKKFIARERQHVRMPQHEETDLDDSKSPVFDESPPPSKIHAERYEPTHRPTEAPPGHAGGRFPGHPQQPAMTYDNKYQQPPPKTDKPPLVRGDAPESQSFDDFFDYMTLSIVALLCCLPFGAMAYKQSKKVRSAKESGDREAAYNASLEAKQFAMASIVTGVVVGIVAILMVAFVWVVILTTR